MDILKNLTNLLNEQPSAGQQYQAPHSQYNQQYAPQQPSADAGGLGSLLNPAVLGSLASALFPSSKINNANPSVAPQDASLGGLGGILGSLMNPGVLAGLFNGKGEEKASIPGYTQPPASIPVQNAQSQQDKVVRMLRALVFAAKADGHIDQDEQEALNNQVEKMNLGPSAKTLLRQFMTEPLDPNLVANGVNSQQEALQIYGLSCAISDMDNFMELSYLDGLATALSIPAQTKNAIEAQVRSGR